MTTTLTIAERVARLTRLERDEMVTDYLQLRRDGFIGDCLLRQVAESWCNDMGSNLQSQVVRIMQDFVFEILLQSYMSY